MIEKHVKCDVVIPAFDWQHDRILDGGYHQAFDYLVYAVDQGWDVKVVFFLVRWTKEEAIEKHVKMFFMLHYGEYEKYKEHIVYLNNQEKYKITTNLFLFVHVKFLTKIFERFIEYGIDIQNDILGTANVIVSKRYDAQSFNTLLNENRQCFNFTNKLSLMLPKYETEYTNDIFDDIIYHDFGINYKNYHTFRNPAIETHMININYQKYTEVLREKIDNFVTQYDNILWFANLDDPRMANIPHSHLVTDDSETIYGMFNHYTHYHYMEPRWQTSNCRMIAESLYLGKEVIYDRIVNYNDEALYKYNAGTRDQFYFNIEDVEVSILLERMK